MPASSRSWPNPQQGRIGAMSPPTNDPSRNLTNGKRAAKVCRFIARAETTVTGRPKQNWGNSYDAAAAGEQFIKHPHNHRIYDFIAR
jgi:hypothetical protein